MNTRIEPNLVKIMLNQDGFLESMGENIICIKISEKNLMSCQGSYIASNISKSPSKRHAHLLFLTNKCNGRPHQQFVYHLLPNRVFIVIHNHIYITFSASTYPDTFCTIMIPSRTGRMTFCTRQSFCTSSLKARIPRV